MTKKELIEALAPFPDNISIGVPCGRDSDDQFLYAEKVLVEEMETKEASGIDPDGTPRTEMVPMVMLLPAEGPWAEELAEDEDRWQRYLIGGQTIPFQSVRGRLHKLAGEAAQKAEPH